MAVTLLLIFPLTHVMVCLFITFTCCGLGDGEGLGVAIATGIGEDSLLIEGFP
jgi:hypothetical protein